MDQTEQVEQNKRTMFAFFAVAIFIIIGSALYFLFFSQCPYELGANFDEWFYKPCPNIVEGKVFGWISGKPLDAGQVSFNGKTFPVSDGKFTIKTREDSGELVIDSPDYGSKKINFSVSGEKGKADVGTISLMPEGRFVYENEGSVFAASFDGSGKKKIMSGNLVAISPSYGKMVVVGPDSSVYLAGTDGSNQTKIIDRVPSNWNRAKPIIFSQNENLLVWPVRYSVDGPSGTHYEEEVYYYNLDTGKKDSVRRVFNTVMGYRVSPNGEYISVWAENIQGNQILMLEDIIRNQTLLEIGNFESAFFDEQNFYYKAPDEQNGSNWAWYVYHLRDGRIDKFSSEPAYWQDKFGGVIDPNDHNKLAVIKVGPVSIYTANIDGTNEKMVASFENEGVSLSELMWAPGGRYLLFNINKGLSKSLWVLDINNGIRKKILDEGDGEVTFDRGRYYVGGGDEIRQGDINPVPLGSPEPMNIPTPKPSANPACEYKKGQYEMRYYDSKGNVTGLVNGKVKEEIPYSVFDEETNDIELFNTNDSYTYEIYDIKEGNYQMEHSSLLNGKAMVFKAQNIPIFPGQTHRYKIDWKALAAGNKGVTVMIDADKDGKFEKTINAGIEFTCEEFRSQMGMQ